MEGKGSINSNQRVKVNTILYSEGEIYYQLVRGKKGLNFSILPTCGGYNLSRHVKLMNSPFPSLASNHLIS